MALALTKPRAGRSLVDPGLFDRLARRVAADAQFDTPTAERIVDQALAFLAACAVSTAPLGPSRLVDHGWHAFILHTREYAAFCDQVASRFIHHVPDEPETATEARDPATTVRAIREAGYAVDEPMWQAAGKCTPCHNGCHNDPPPNPPAPSGRGV